MTPDPSSGIVSVGLGSSGALEHEAGLETTVETVSARISAAGEANPPVSAPRHRQTPFRRRLPRFARSKRSHRPPIALQDRDLQLLQTVSEYRLISTPQFLRLFNSESQDGIYRRLQRLFHHGYLDRVGRNPNAPLVYALGRRGSEVLGVGPRKTVGEPYILHQLMVSDVRAGLTIACSQRSIELTWRRVPRDIPIQPDGFFGLRFLDRPEGANRTNFFLEADRSTMPRGRFVEKLLAYHAWYQCGGHTAAVGIKSFRVLTVVKSKERLASLLAAATAEPRLQARSGAYWFSTLPEVSGGPLEEVWLTAADTERRQAFLPRPDPASARVCRCEQRDR